MKETVYIPMSEIKINPLNQRRVDEDQIEVLAESIANVGLINPLIVYQKSEDEFVLIDGHRRYCALSKMGRVGNNQVPCIVVDKPADEIKEQELMANGNIHRNKPEDLKQEIEIANVLWNTMNSNRRAKLSEEFRDKFIEKHCGEEKYQEAPAQYISNRFRPRIDYIRSITGLDYSNKTVTNVLSDILNSKQEQFNGPTERKVEEPKQLTAKDIIRSIRALKGQLMVFGENEENQSKKHQIEAVIDTLTILENVL